MCSLAIVITKSILEHYQLSWWQYTNLFINQSIILWNGPVQHDNCSSVMTKVLYIRICIYICILNWQRIANIFHYGQVMGFLLWSSITTWFNVAWHCIQYSCDNITIWYKLWTQNRHPIVHLKGWAMGCLLWLFCIKLTRVIALLIPTQGSFWVWAGPISDDFTM